jgi:hypothetical protein
VSKEIGLSKQAIMSVRESGIPRGATHAKAVEGLIDQDARERSAWESQTRMLSFCRPLCLLIHVLTAKFWFAAVGGRVKGGVAAEMQSAAAKLHAAIEQASTVNVGATANSTNGAAPLVRITETVDADTLIKHVADVKVRVTAPIRALLFS